MRAGYPDGVGWAPLFGLLQLFAQLLGFGAGQCRPKAGPYPGFFERDVLAPGRDELSQQLLELGVIGAGLV